MRSRQHTGTTLERTHRVLPGAPDGSSLVSGDDGAQWLRSAIQHTRRELARILTGLALHSSCDQPVPPTLLTRMFDLCNHFSKWLGCRGIGFSCHERPDYPVCPMPHSGFSIRISHLNDTNTITGSVLIECNDSDTRHYSPDYWSGPAGEILDAVDRRTPSA